MEMPRRPSSRHGFFRVERWNPALFWLGLVPLAAVLWNAPEAGGQEAGRGQVPGVLNATGGLSGAVSSALPQEPIPDFELIDTDGATRSLGEFRSSQLLVVSFSGCDCPLARLYAARLGELKSKYSDQPVAWLMINSNLQDSLAETRHFARANRLQMPLLKDPGNRVADLFQAERTPEVFLLDAGRRVRYRGRIDDQYEYGRQRTEPTSRDLQSAIDGLLAGREVAVARTETAGCIIGRALKADPAVGESAVTWSNQIVRILQKNCTSCHRQGEIGPFELVSHEDAAGWAGMIREVVNQRRMPPWHASPGHGEFRNDSRLSDGDIAAINAWVAAGAPEGDPADLPPPPQYASGWQIGEPDLVVPMSRRPYSVPASGTVEYQYFEADPGFTEDRWISAAECRPDQRGVIHHIIVGIAGEGDFGRRVHEGAQSDWIAASAPGSPPMVLPAGYAKLVPAGSRLIFQIHYTPNGTAVEDLSSIGLKFADPASVTHRVLTLKAANQRFEIPPHAAEHPVRARFRFEQAAELISLFPHMHLRGRAFRYTAFFPDGRSEILLDVPAYDFNWQNGYELLQPRLIPAGTRLVCDAVFDNSTSNIANPDPEATVRWGDQTWEEMMIGYFNAAVPVGRPVR